MLLQTSFSFLAIILPSLSHAHPFHPLVTRNVTQLPTRPLPKNARMCGVGPPPEPLLEVHDTLHQEARIIPVTQKKTASAREIIVDLYIHVVSTLDQARRFTPEVLAGLVAAQSSVLNTAYRPSNITFRTQPYTYTIKDDWATDYDDKSMKTALRRGGYDALNIYFQTNLSTPSPPGTEASTLLGYCTLPQSVTFVPPNCPPANKTANGQCLKQPLGPSSYINDGCNVLASTMPSGGLQDYQEGKTAVHEVGHWFGLLHTFQDESCDPTDPGDYVDDTPQESVSTDGCPSLEGYVKNSCPGSVGDDPIHNFMDYSSDACYTGFSDGQRFRMTNLWNLYRKGN